MHHDWIPWLMLLLHIVCVVEGERHGGVACRTGVEGALIAGRIIIIMRTSDAVLLIYEVLVVVARVQARNPRLQFRRLYQPQGSATLS